MPSIDEKHLPHLMGNQFRCPHCDVVAQQMWTSPYFANGISPKGDVKLSYCCVCEKLALWNGRVLCWPQPKQIPPPSLDMPASVGTIYEEARSVYNLSPKSAAALLRLAIQHLCMELGGTGKDLNKDIGKLVNDGLPLKVQQALDVVRVVGNNAVHPGQISIDDNPNIVTALFKLINLLVEDMITQPAEVATMFDALPTGAKKQIEERDAKKRLSPGTP